MTLRLDVDRLFKSIDQMDADEFSSFLTEDGVFTFGNAEPVRGRQAVRDAVAGFFSSIAGLHHHDATTWDADEVVVTEGRSTYTRHDGGVVEVPFVNVYRMEGDLIRDYRIYIDISPVYAD